MIKLMCFIVITQMILYILPGEQYRKYAKLMIGLLLMVIMLQMMSSIMQRLSVTGIAQWFSGGNEKLNYENEMMKKMEESRNHAVLSTYENNIKDRLNKLDFQDEYYVTCVNINVYDNVDNVDYGQIQSLIVQLSKNVDKSANIMVNRVIVGKKEENTENIQMNKRKKIISKELCVNEEVIEIVVLEE